MRMAAPLTRAYIEPLAVVERPPPTVVLSVWDMLAPLCGVRVVIVFSSVVDRCVRALAIIALNSCSPYQPAPACHSMRYRRPSAVHCSVVCLLVGCSECASAVQCSVMRCCARACRVNSCVSCRVSISCCQYTPMSPDVTATSQSLRGIVCVCVCER